MNDLSVSVCHPSGPILRKALPDAAPKVTVRNLNFYYGEHHALKNINLTLGTNRVTAFIGPSGCGKSTLLRIFNRMYDLYPGQRAEGQLMLDGTNILDPRLDLNLLRARVGMVFQKPTPFPMTIYENIAFGIRLYEKISKSEMDGRVEKALRGGALWNEVKDKLNASGLSLSGGQQQRLCIARTVAVRPEVILFDEPCSALDPISTAKVEELIEELAENYTIAIVTHNMQQAARVSDKTAFMYLGELIEFDDTSKIFTTPSDRRPRTTSPAGSADARTAEEISMASEHTAKAFDSDLQELTRLVAEMGGLAERMIVDSIDALVRRDIALGQRVVAADAEIDTLQRDDRGARGADHRAPPADGGRPARDRRRHARRDRSRADRRPRQEHRQARLGDRQRFPAAEADPRAGAHGRPRAVAAQGRCSTPMPRTICRARWPCGSATTRSTRSTPRCSANC